MKKYFKSIFIKKIIFFILIIIITSTISSHTTASKVEAEYFNIRAEKNNLTIINSNTLSTNISSGLMDSCWPMSCHDLHHTSRSPYSTADNPGGEKWRFQTEGRMESGMAIDNDGVIYFGELGVNLYAVYPDGSLKWEYNVGDWIWSTPAIAEDGTVYIGSLNANFYAIDPNGSLKWKFKPGGSVYSSPAIRDDGVIVFGTMKGFDKGDIVALYPNGTLYWRYQTDYYITSDPAIADDGTIYIGSGDNYLYAINSDGTLKWRFKTGDWIKSHPSIADDGTIYFSSFDDYLYALNPNGTLKWRYSGSYGGSSSTALGLDGTIYVAGKNSLLAINPDGTNKWSCPLGSNIDHSSPIIDTDGIIYTGVSAGEIIAINPDGTERWCKNIGNHGVYSLPCIGSDGTIYIGSSSEDEWGSFGFLHTFAPQNNNHIPDTPEVSGNPNRKVGEEIHCVVTSNDPDNNPLSFYVDWGDGTNTDWEYDTTSNGYNYFYHTYSSQGIYLIKAKARDDFSGESDWGTFTITISKSKAINTSFFWQKLIQCFPIFEKILNQII
jgi:outer membrane protein assembly factor BamB